MLLVKLIEPPCTERYARWCERSKIPHQEEFSPTRYKRFSEQVGGRMLMIGRLEELKQLEKFYKSSKFEFLTLCFSVSQDLQNP